MYPLQTWFNDPFYKPRYVIKFKIIYYFNSSSCSFLPAVRNVQNTWKNTWNTTLVILNHLGGKQLILNSLRSYNDRENTALYRFIEIISFQRKYTFSQIYRDHIIIEEIHLFIDSQRSYHYRGNTPLIDSLRSHHYRGNTTFIDLQRSYLYREIHLFIDSQRSYHYRENKPFIHSQRSYHYRGNTPFIDSQRSHHYRGNTPFIDSQRSYHYRLNTALYRFIEII